MLVGKNCVIIDNGYTFTKFICNHQWYWFVLCVELRQTIFSENSSNSFAIIRIRIIWESIANIMNALWLVGKHWRRCFKTEFPINSIN